MIVNIIVISLILSFGFIFLKGYRQKVNSDQIRKRYIKIICFILILQSGLRNVAVGDDTYNYYQWFEDVKHETWKDIIIEFKDYYQFGIGTDPGYVIFQKLSQLISESFQVHLVLIAIIFFTSLGFFIYKNTSRFIDVIIAFLIYSVLFYSFFSITGIRQTIATAAVLFSFEFVKKKRIIPFLLLILLVSTIHKSALIFLPFYFIARIKKTKIIFGSVIILFPVFVLFRNRIADLLKMIGGYKVYEQFEGAGTLTFTAFFLCISIVALFRSKRILADNPNAQPYYNAFAVALILIPITWINPTLLRVVMYFSIFMLLFIPEILNSFKYILKNSRQNFRGDVTRFAVIVLVALFLKTSWNKESSSYKFFWQEMRLPSIYYIRD